MKASPIAIVEAVSGRQHFTGVDAALHDLGCDATWIPAGEQPHRLPDRARQRAHERQDGALGHAETRGRLEKLKKPLNFNHLRSRYNPHNQQCGCKVSCLGRAQVANGNRLSLGEIRYE